ncbi:hypothetical protein O181_105825 [Austropuccinia psidii MF-1]|uniref:Tf2-1-like SH3-like domain-containing protein n=1 Tax=Austropuccinia psidii MF-1 TaxID=1389203 RepID=A0A9Q3JR82_9BASI|nr:hypothetical protein [Austropuccinia psidii MF-1]
MVLRSSKNIKLTRPTKKISERWLDPFPILKKVSTHAYQLKIPSQWRSIHPVFHISLLESVKTSAIPNQHPGPSPEIIIEEEEEWEVSQIVNLKLKRGKLTNSSSRLNISGTPASKSISTASKGFSLVLVLRSLPFKVGGTVATMGKNPPIGVYGNSDLTQSMANWPLVWPFGNTHSSWPFMTSFHILLHWPSWKIPHHTRPQTNITVLVPGESFAPSAILRASG